MLDGYRLFGPTQKMEIEIEKSVADTIFKMEQHMKITKAELINIALKRFITSHKDFLPNESLKKK